MCSAFGRDIEQAGLQIGVQCNWCNRNKYVSRHVSPLAVNICIGLCFGPGLKLVGKIAVGGWLCMQRFLMFRLVGKNLRWTPPPWLLCNDSPSMIPPRWLLLHEFFSNIPTIIPSEWFLSHDSFEWFLLDPFFKIPSQWLLLNDSYSMMRPEYFFLNVSSSMMTPKWLVLDE